MLTIKYPESPLYFIAWTEATPARIVSYGKVESSQCMESGLDNIETFFDEEIFRNRLLQFEIYDY